MGSWGAQGRRSAAAKQDVNRRPPGLHSGTRDPRSDGGRAIVVGLVWESQSRRGSRTFPWARGPRGSLTRAKFP